MYKFTEQIEKVITKCLESGISNDMYLHDTEETQIVANWEPWEDDNDYDVISIYIYQNGHIKMNIQIEETKVNLKVTERVFEFIKKFNGNKEDYFKSDSRVYYVFKEKNIIDCFYINTIHTLAESNKIAKELFNIMYNDLHKLEYTGQYEERAFNLSDYKKENEYFRHHSSIFIA